MKLMHFFFKLILKESNLGLNASKIFQARFQFHQSMYKNRVENNFEIVAFLLFWELRISAENVAGSLKIMINDYCYFEFSCSRFPFMQDNELEFQKDESYSTFVLYIPWIMRMR